MKEVYIKYWKNAFDFSSSTSRRDYWLTVLACFIASFVVGFVIGLVFPYEYNITAGVGASYSGSMIGIVLSYLWSLANIIPGLAIQIRRMHDLGKSGWWIFIVFVPIIGWLWYLILLCTKGKE